MVTSLQMTSCNKLDFNRLVVTSQKLTSLLQLVAISQKNWQLVTSQWRFGLCKAYQNSSSLQHQNSSSRGENMQEESPASPVNEMILIYSYCYIFKWSSRFHESYCRNWINKEYSRLDLFQEQFWTDKAIYSLFIKSSYFCLGFLL